MTRTGRKIFQSIIESIKDLLPIIIVVGFFQIFVIQKPLDDLLLILEGLLLIILGLTFFVFGLKIGFFPAGENLAYNFVERASLSWLLIFGFALGFGVTIAEPDLIVISAEVAKAIQESQIIDSTDEARKSFQNMFRSIIAFCVGISVILGVLKILKNWSTHSISSSSIFWLYCSHLWLLNTLLESPMTQVGLLHLQSPFLLLLQLASVLPVLSGEETLLWMGLV